MRRIPGQPVLLSVDLDRSVALSGLDCVANNGGIIVPYCDSSGGHRFPKDVILLAVRWYCRYPLSYRDVRNLLAERGIAADAATVYRWVQKFGPEIRKRAYGRHRS